MPKLSFALENDEQIIDTFTILYIPPGGGKYNGKLTITNKRSCMMPGMTYLPKDCCLKPYLLNGEVRVILL